MLIVKKFGGSSVANAERINHVAQTIVNSYKEGNQVVVVSKRIKERNGYAFINW